MTEQEWLISTDPDKMFHFLRYAPVGVGGRLRGTKEGGPELVSDRKLRLFACACHRYASTDCGPRELEAIELAERFADGDTSVKLKEAWTVSAFSAMHAAAEFCQTTGREKQFAAPRASLLRDVFGNPYRPIKTTHDLYKTGDKDAPDAIKDRNGEVALSLCRLCRKGESELEEPCSWISWNDGTVLRLAQSIYDERRFENLSVLADAIEEAGCLNEEILMHCRNKEKRFSAATCGGQGTEDLPPYEHWTDTNSPHVRGCWVIDLILGKE